MILPFLAQRLFLIQISWNSKSVLSLGSYTWKNGQIRSAGRTVRQNRQFSGDRFFHVLDHLESIWKKKNFSKNFRPKKLRKISRFITGTLESSTGKKWNYHVIAINLEIFLSFFGRKFLLKIFFSKSTPNGPKREKKRSPVLPDGPSGGPNLTIFACVGTQTKYRFRVSGYLDQKWSLC